MKTITCILLMAIIFINYAQGETEPGPVRATMETEYHLSPGDYFISDQYTDKSTGITHVYLQQKYSGIPVYNAITNLAIKNNKVVHSQSTFVEAKKLKSKISKPSISAKEAINFALKHLEIVPDPSLKQIENREENKFLFKTEKYSNIPVMVELVYTLFEENLYLSWNVSIDLKGKSHWWNVRVDATNGNFLDKNDYVVSCAPLPPVSSSYNVFPFPTEAPTFGSRALLSNPEDLSASPFGWHDENGIIGPEHTITRGNNVHAYEDMDSDDLPGYSPNGTPTLTFNFPYNFNLQPINNEDASLTNLFYANNKIHDYLYHFGFTETSGNFQKNNYGNGGSGDDPVLAEGFDGSGTDNANFATPPDGYSGRMQMYLWNGVPCGSFTVNSPGNIAGPMPFSGAEFNPVPATVTANLVLVNDGSGSPTLGCNPIIGSLAGKIAVIDRGSCFFVIKVLNAQAAGAIGVVIINNVPGTFFMTGIEPLITIPSVMVTDVDGAILKNAMLAGAVNVTISTCPPLNADSDFDNGIIAHEYGHGVSNRLTGGPSNSGCLANAEQAGEGWSDYFAIMLTIKPGDNANTPRSLASYSSGQPNTGPGNRTFPYTHDMNINPHIYTDIAFFPETHYIGEIWCSTIWDMTWDLINISGYSPSPANTSAGNNIAMTLVMEGMKLQVCGPGFLDSRDAILLADHLLYNDAHRCLIWNAFARRGMGGNASQGNSNIAGDEIADFTIPSIKPFPSGGGAFCLPANATLDAGAGWLSYHWSSGQTTQTIVPNAFGTYTVTVTGRGCSNTIESGSATLNVVPSFTPSTTATPDKVCPGGNSNLFAKVDVQIGNSISTNSEGSNPAPYGNWYTGNHEQYLFRASELIAAGLLPGNITGLAFDVVTHNTGPGSQNLKISIAQTNATSLTNTFINNGFSTVYSSAFFSSVTGWNNHIFSSPFNWNGVSNIVVDVSMLNCSTCPANACVEYYQNDVVHLSKSNFQSCTFSVSDFDCSVATFTPAVPVLTTNERPNTKFFGSSIPSTFSWSPSTFLSATNIANPIANNVTSTTTYSVTATTPAGCIGTGTQTVTVITIPATPVAIQGPLQVCKGQMNVTYCVEEIPGATNYQWTLPSGMAGSSVSNCITINVSTKFKGGTICVKAKNGCFTGQNKCVTIGILQDKPAKPGLISGVTPACLSSVQTYCINTVASADSYDWTIGGNGGLDPLIILWGQGTTCLDVYVPERYKGNQNIKVRAVNCKGSGDERKLDINALSVPVTPSAINGPASVCKNATKSFSVQNIPTASSYTWDISGGATIQSGQGTKNVSVKFNTATNASAVITVFAINDCGSSTAISKTIAVNLACKFADDSDISSSSDIESLVAYPNPTSDKLNITFKSFNEDPYIVSIVDVLGRTILSDAKVAAIGTNTFTIDIANTASGMYTLVIRKGDAVIKQMIVKN